MSRLEAIERLQATLAGLSTEQVEALAELASSLGRTIPEEDAATRAAIAEGFDQAERGDFASDEEVEAAFARFRK